MTMKDDHLVTSLPEEIGQLTQEAVLHETITIDELQRESIDWVKKQIRHAFYCNVPTSMMRSFLERVVSNVPDSEIVQLWYDILYCAKLPNSSMEGAISSILPKKNITNPTKTSLRIR